MAEIKFVGRATGPLVKRGSWGILPFEDFEVTLYDEEQVNKAERVVPSTYCFIVGNVYLNMPSNNGRPRQALGGKDV